MKKIALLLVMVLLVGMFGGCAKTEPADIAATTLPVYQFTSLLCENTGLTVARLVSESVSCLHDYALSVDQVRTVEAARLVVISGAGLEDFMNDLLEEKEVLDASEGIHLLESCHSHGGNHADHKHEADPHIWLSVANAKAMAVNILDGLCNHFPEHAATFQSNMEKLMAQLQTLETYANAQLAGLSSRDMITFHDGFAYLADAYDLHILAAVEEESGSEVSSQTLIGLIDLVKSQNVQAIFMEENGSDAAAKTISTETGVNLYILNMAMSGDDYFEAMYHNIDTIREALR